MFVRKLFRHIWPKIMEYKWSFYLTFAFYGLRVFLISVLKAFYFKKIIDLISSPDLTRVALAHELYYLVFINILIIIGDYACSRFGAWTIVYSQSNIMRELSNYSFKKIINNSYHFFSNRFVGSLVTKSRRFIRAFEVMYDTSVYSFWSTFIILLGVFVILFVQAPKIALIFFIWVLFYLTLVSLFVKKRMRYDFNKAEADSRVGGRLADVFTNIFALKVFSAREREQNSFGEVTQNEQKHRNKSWYFGNLQDGVQAALMVIVQAFILYLMGNAYPLNKIGGSVKDSLEKAADLLGDGWSLVVSPEGRISPTGELQPFKLGVATLAVETGVPVVPIKIKGYRAIYPRIKKPPYIPEGRGRVEVTIGKPINFNGKTNYTKANSILEEAMKIL